MTFQASEEYREHSTHKTQRARKSRQRQNQHVVEQRSTTLQESSTVTTKRSSQQELSKKNFNVIRLNSIPLPLASGGTVICEYIFNIFNSNFFFRKNNWHNDNLIIFIWKIIRVFSIPSRILQKHIHKCKYR